MLKTAIVQTLTALPTNTAAPILNSETPPFIEEGLSSSTETLEPTIDISTAALAVDTATVTMGPTGTLEIAGVTGVTTGTFEVATSTELPATPVVGPATVTLTPGVLTYGTLPPAVPSSKLTLINRSKTKAYISLQVVTAKGGPAIIEYPVTRRIEVDAPVGEYLYVAWVGGRKMVGEFRLRHDEDMEIILYRDRVVVQ
jgi:hypothetical protein